ncbi:Peptidyl-prolyl cis-trans isomerase D [Candidatus Hartigia pinicola]|nr:Peptidyl-prolyl cis-trans isomerase D [Candidatus Hartigia pinicola]
MIGNLCTKSKSYFNIFILVITIFPFVLTGIASYIISGSSNDAAQVNGQTISRSQLEQAFSQECQSLKEYLGDKFLEFSENKNNMTLLRRQVLDKLINSELINQYAYDLRLFVSDEEIEKVIFSMPIFQKDQHFNSNKYRQRLKQYNINAANLAEQVRNYLVREQLSQLFTKSDFSLPSELKAYTELFLQKREIRTATFFLEDVQAKQVVTEEDVKAYYIANHRHFMSPEKVRVSYIDININALPEVIVTDEELKVYYKNHQKNYTTVEKKSYRMIQVSSKEEAKEISNKLKNGADFRKLATQKSTDKFSAAHEGLIGWIEDESIFSEISIANLSEKGQLSKPIKFGSNFIIFRLDDIKPASIKSFDSVKNSIKNILSEEKKNNQFYKLQENISNEITHNNKDLVFIEKAFGLQVITTDWFDKNTPPIALNFQKVLNEIFSERLINQYGSTGINSDVINVEGNRAFVVRVVAFKPAQQESLEIVKSKVERLIKRQKAILALKLQGKKIVEALKEDPDKKMLNTTDVQFSSPEIVSRLAPQTFVISAAMGMKTPQVGQPTYMTIMDERDNLVIIQLDRVIPGKASGKELIKLTRKYQEIINTSINEAMLLTLRNNAKIKVFRLE